MRTGHVYGLYDVRSTGEYRYVGRTVGTLHKRLWRHRRTVRGMPHLWVARWMAAIGPHNVRIESLGVYPESELPFWECFWMAALREAGHDLTNVAPGGSGAGFPKGYYKHSPETLEKVRVNHAHAKPWLGKKRSAADRAAISAGLKRYHSGLPPD